jgi:outer membrane autotransporter protein
LGYAALVPVEGDIINLQGLPKVEIWSVALLLSHLPTSGLKGNNLKLADYINTYCPDTAFYFIPSAISGTLPQALASAAPTRHAADIFTASTNLFFLNTALTEHGEDTGHYWTFQESDCRNRGRQRKKEPPCTPALRPCQLWTSVLGASSRQKKEHETPRFDPWTGGVMIGLDYHASLSTVYGIGTAYTYTYINEKRAGHSRINQEYLFAYGVWNAHHFYGSAAFWVGAFQINNTRKIEMVSFEFEATSHPRGWQLAPHLEVGYRGWHNNIGWEPFAAVDWIYNQQSSYQERGHGPFNFGQRASFSSFLRGELGLKVSETLPFDSWRLVFQEKLSYVQRTPFRVGKMRTYLVGTPATFTVETLARSQALGVAGAKIAFESKTAGYPYGSIDYQGEFGSRYQSQQLSMSLSWSF